MYNREYVSNIDVILLQVSELLCLIAPEHPEAMELTQLLQCHHFKVFNPAHASALAEYTVDLENREQVKERR